MTFDLGSFVIGLATFYLAMASYHGISHIVHNRTGRWLPVDILGHWAHAKYIEPVAEWVRVLETKRE